MAIGANQREVRLDVSVIVDLLDVRLKWGNKIVGASFQAGRSGGEDVIIFLVEKSDDPPQD